MSLAGMNLNSPKGWGIDDTCVILNENPSDDETKLDWEMSFVKSKNVPAKFDEIEAPSILSGNKSKIAPLFALANPAACKSF